MPRAIINRAAMRELEDTIGHEILTRWAGPVVEDARRDAPKRTGDMAASIDFEIRRDGEGIYAVVSWDQDHWYGYFAEVGTSREAARPFLRPAGTQDRHL